MRFLNCLRILLSLYSYRQRYNIFCIRQFFFNKLRKVVYSQGFLYPKRWGSYDWNEKIRRYPPFLDFVANGWLFPTKQAEDQLCYWCDSSTYRGIPRTAVRAILSCRKSCVYLSTFRTCDWFEFRHIAISFGRVLYGLQHHGRHRTHQSAYELFFLVQPEQFVGFGAGFGFDFGIDIAGDKLYNGGEGGSIVGETSDGNEVRDEVQRENKIP